MTERPLENTLNFSVHKSIEILITLMRIYIKGKYICESSNEHRDYFSKLYIYIVKIDI